MFFLIFRSIFPLPFTKKPPLSSKKKAPKSILQSYKRTHMKIAQLPRLSTPDDSIYFNRTYLEQFQQKEMAVSCPVIQVNVACNWTAWKSWVFLNSFIIVLRVQPMQTSNQDLIQNLIVEEETGVSQPTAPSDPSKAFKARQRYNSQDRELRGSNIFSKLFFTWISCLLSLGNHCSVDTEDLPSLPPSMHPRIEYESLHNALQRTKISPRKGWTLLKAISKSYRFQLVALGGLALLITALTMTAPVLTHRIITYIKQIPQDRSTEEGVWLVVGITLITLGKAILQSHLYYKFAVFGFNLSNTLSLLIYAKSLKYAALCEKKYSISEIINYSQVDAQRMTNMGVQLTSLLFTPIQIIIGVWLMYTYIGVSFGSGMATMLAMIAMTFYLAKRISKVNENTLKAKDARMKVTEQILDIIRFIKINAIEKYFFRKLDVKRSEELNSNRQRGFLEVLIVFLYFLSCPLIIFLTFLTYISLDNTIDATIAFSTIMIFNILQSPLRQFPSALSSLIQMYTSISRIEEFLLAREINYAHIRNDTDEESIAVRIENGTFRWGVQEEKGQKKVVSEEVKEYRRKHSSHIEEEEEINADDDEVDSPESNSPRTPKRKSQITTGKTNKDSLSEISTDEFTQEEVSVVGGQKPQYLSAIKNANFAIQKGKFVIVLGDIGSGKSSFLLAILNQMKNSGNSMVTVNGSVAYAAQKPCIMSGTVRENILFGAGYDKKRFEQSLYYASLRTDLKLLVKGEFTEIGQKGVNLSGGQKARIAFARALYSDKDILLLDDIISAVDVHVGEFLIRESILGFLRSKTVIMPTHAANFAQHADEVIVLRKGIIVRKGHFRDICQTPEFQEVYQQSMQRQQSSQTKEDIKINNDQKKIKNTIELIKQAKLSMRQSRGPGNKSFAEKAIEQLIIPEDHKKGSIDPAILKEYIRLNGGVVFVLIVLGSMGAWLSFSIFSNMQMEEWCKGTHDDYHLYVYLALSVLSSLSAFLRAYILVLSGFKQGEIVHRKIIKSLLYASLNEFYSRIPVGRIMNRLTKDLRELDETIGYAMGNYLTNLFSLIGTLSICIYGSTPFMIIPCIIIIYLCNRLRGYYMNTQREIIRIEAKTNSPIVSGFISTIHGLATIRAYKVEADFLETQIKRIETNKAARITREALESWFAFRLTLLSFFISISSIGWALVSSSSSPAMIGLLLSYAFNLNDDIISLTFSWANLETRMVSVERIFNFMKIQPEPAYEEYCKDWTENDEECKAVLTRGEIEFKNINVRYRPDLPYALKSLSFRVLPGEKVGVVGRTGAGKSSIFSTLLRVIDAQSGQILLDGANSSSYSLRELRSAITMIDQEPQLISSTFRQNLDMKHEYTDDQLYAILEECNLYHTVMEKDGLDGKVDNNSLSAGEKQLLCICRAFLKRSKLVLIDEATANIDMKNDQLIQQVIQQKFKHSTVLTIAHRLSTLRNSDKILVMGEGRVLEWGSPRQLQERPNGIFAQMMSKNLSEFLV